MSSSWNKSPSKLYAQMASTHGSSVSGKKSGSKPTAAEIIRKMKK